MCFLDGSDKRSLEDIYTYTIVYSEIFESFEVMKSHDFYLYFLLLQT